MKTISFILLIACSSIQTDSQKIIVSVFINNQVIFYQYEGPYGEKENIKEPADKIILTVRNTGDEPIPDLGVTNRSKYVNLIINDSIHNPLSLYIGIETIGDHLIKKYDSDTYTFWLFKNEANNYGEIFTIQWQYMSSFSKKLKVYLIKETVEQVN